MKNCGMGTFMRSRRFGSYFDAWSGLDLGAQSQVVVKGELEGKKQKTRDNVYVEDDGWLCVLISWIRIVVCFVSMMVTTLVWAVIMLVLLPWPYQRIRQGNIYGHVTGRMLVSYTFFLCLNFPFNCLFYSRMVWNSDFACICSEFSVLSYLTC